MSLFCLASKLNQIELQTFKWKMIALYCKFRKPKRILQKDSYMIEQIYLIKETQWRKTKEVRGISSALNCDFFD